MGLRRRAAISVGLVSMVILSMLSAAQPVVLLQEATVRMIAVEGEGAKYWPRWRGPSGQGLVSSMGYPDKWSATENVLWKTPVPGVAVSSPIVWGDRIFVSTAVSSDTSAGIRTGLYGDVEPAKDV